jgi:hypothetical protein
MVKQYLCECESPHCHELINTDIETSQRLRNIFLHPVIKGHPLPEGGEIIYSGNEYDLYQLTSDE